MFHTSSQQIRYIIKGLELSKTLLVSSIIIGEPSIGKKTLVKHIFPEAIWVDGGDVNALKNALATYQEIVIFNFNMYGDYNLLDFNGKRVIAISNTINTTSQIDTLFAFIYNMPSLSQRVEDVEYLSDKFYNEAQSIFGKTIEYVLNSTDLQDNTKSLKKAIFLHCAYSGITFEEMETILYNHFINKLGGNNDYNKFLPIFEKPLIEAGLNKFSSQLKLSGILGINRNTLRKKINELGIN